MKLSELVEILQESGLPVTHYQWPEDKVPELPYLVYTIPNSDGEYADNQTWAEIAEIDVELYSNERNFQLEDKIKDILNAHELPFTTEFTYIESEQMYQTIFYLNEVIEHE